jgi:hypothetical protein
VENLSRYDRGHVGVEKLSSYGNAEPFSQTMRSDLGNMRTMRRVRSILSSSSGEQTFWKTGGRNNKPNYYRHKEMFDKKILVKK